MHCSLIINNEALDYRWVRSNRKTIAITIAPDQSVTVKSPQRASKPMIETLLTEKWAWILKTRRKLAAVKPVQQQAYNHGALVRYLGRDYRLEIQQASDQEAICIQGDALQLHSHFPATPLHVKCQLDAWLTAQAQRLFAERLAACTQQWQIKNPPALAVRHMKTRWGSYSRKTHRVCLNHRLIHASLDQIDFVIVHELCHIEHMAHNAAFYRLLTHRIPHWKQLKQDLDRKNRTA